jgi:hypothetical protein
VVIAAEREGIRTMSTEIITACVVTVLAVILGMRRIVRALRLLTQESGGFLGDIVVFSQKGRVLRGELRKWRKRERTKTKTEV